MAKFHFALNTLMRLRTAHRDAIAVELAQLQGDGHAIDLQLKQIDDARRALQDQIRTEPSPTHVQGWIERDRCQGHLESQRSAMLTRRAEVASDIESLTKNSLTARRDVRTLEHLHDRRLEEYQRHQVRLEIQQSDATSRTRANLCP